MRWHPTEITGGGLPSTAIAEHRVASPVNFSPNNNGRIVARLWHLGLHKCSEMDLQRGAKANC
jgi:hypothetical protein